jgi:hypothetical protein
MTGARRGEVTATYNTAATEQMIRLTKTENNQDVEKPAGLAAQ